MRSVLWSYTDGMSLSTRPSSTVEWKFSQVFGERSPEEEVQEVDKISTIEFDKSGEYLAVGDCGGRVVIFKRKDDKDDHLQHLEHIVSSPPKYEYLTEFQSHEPEFDYLKSVEIEEKINKVRWYATLNGTLLILSANDKTIKLWKVREGKAKKVKEMECSPYVSSENALLAERSFLNDQDRPTENGYHLEWIENAAQKNLSPRKPFSGIAYKPGVAYSRCRKVFAHAHDFSINSISANSDGETFISADDLRINLWNLEISDECFNMVDIKPESMEDLTEVITSAEFHPIHCNLLAYSTSRGFIHLIDMRQSAICDRNARILQEVETGGSKSFFTEIIASISSIKFAPDGKQLLSRDYLNLKLWDLRMDSKPVAIFKVHEHLRPKLPELYNNDSIFDKFDCSISGDGLQFASGSYSNLLRIFSLGASSEDGITIEASKNPNRKMLPSAVSRARKSTLGNLAWGFYRQVQDISSTGSEDLFYSLSDKLLHVTWHPTTNLIACAAGNSLFMYHG